MNLAALERFVDDSAGTVLDWRYKGFGRSFPGLTVGRVRAEGVLLRQLGTPMMTIDTEATAHNMVVMSAWCRSRGVQLAPHGKTSMSPTLWLGQLLSGSVAITVANAAQLRAARAMGVPSLMLANELVDPAEVRWVVDELGGDDDLSFSAWVDSVDGVALMTRALSGARIRRRIRVLVEIGTDGGRTGTRGIDQAVDVAEAVVAAPGLELAGLSGYEGSVLGAGAHAAGLEAVAAYLTSIVDAIEACRSLVETERLTVSAGGSAHFDQVADALAKIGERSGSPVDVVLRSGVYVAHDSGHYAQVTPSRRKSGPTLRAAVHVWARVLSRPQSDLAIIDAGRRDVSFDLGLPVVVSAVRCDETVRRIDPGPATVTQLNDQHGFVRVDPASELAVGDVVQLGVSHPCTTFDKWRAIPMIDSAQRLEPRVTDVALTYF